MRSTTLILPPLAVLALIAPRTLHADPSRTVEIEIVDTPKAGASHLSHFAVSVALDRGWFATDTQDGAASLHLGARIDHQPSGELLTIEVRRHGVGDFDVQAARTLAQPARTLMGKVERDAGRSEVFVTVK
jgi:hypothetical protein